MINWSKYFDKIICIHYNEMITRKQLIEFQLKRVGILDSGIFEWQITFQNKYQHNYKNMLSTLEQENIGKNTWNDYSCTKGHYNAIKRAYYQGCNRVLIIQDDARFLRDLDKIEQILENIPDQKDWQVLLFNYIIHTYIPFYNDIKNKKNKINNYYFKFTDRSIIYSAACYCLNRKAIEKYLTAWDIKYITINDWSWNNIPTKTFDFKSLYNKKVLCIPNISIQIIFSKAHNIINNKVDKQKLSFQYKNQDINFDDYMMRKDGSKYDYGDYIEE